MTVERWTRDDATRRWTRHRTAEPGDQEGPVAMPPPEVTEREIDPRHPSLPRIISSTASWAIEAGWAVRLTWARGPKRRVDPVRYEQTTTMVLRCSKPGRRVVFSWARNEETGKWSSDGCYDGVYHPCSVAAAKEELLR